MSKEFICKGCGEKFNKDMQSSNVGYCYICNEFYMRKQVADLEAKLAESEKEKNYYQDLYFTSVKGQEKLKQQLAEKEHSIGILNQHITDKAIEIERLGEELKELKTENMNIFEHSQKIEQQLAEIEKKLEEVKKSKTYIMHFGDKVKEVQVVDDNQNKISFAIEQLTKIREYVKECWGLDELEGKVRLDIAKKIRLKIEQLKEMKNDTD